MSRFVLHFRVLLVLLGSLASGELRADESMSKQPNVLFIMSDDHTTQAIGEYGSPRNNTVIATFTCPIPNK